MTPAGCRAVFAGPRFGGASGQLSADFVYHVKLITGAELPVVTNAGQTPSGNGVYIGESQETRALGIDAAGKAGGVNVIIPAADTPYLVGTTLFVKVSTCSYTPGAGGSELIDSVSTDGGKSRVEAARRSAPTGEDSWGSVQADISGPVKGKNEFLLKVTFKKGNERLLRLQINAVPE